MTFPSTPRVVPIRPIESSVPDLEMIYRETCWEFLDACFNGASRDYIALLGAAVFEDLDRWRQSGDMRARRGYR